MSTGTAEARGPKRKKGLRKVTAARSSEEPPALLEIAEERHVVGHIGREPHVVHVLLAALALIALGPGAHRLAIRGVELPGLERHFLTRLDVDERRSVLEVERPLGGVQEVEEDHLVAAVAEVAAAPGRPRRPVHEAP